MLQRAAKNAYSWWWASHIRTKQSKWLDQNLQDMEEKVEYILKIINQDGDSFAVRAEMYYRKRPELVNFVEDCFRGYRALAERYDHLSRDLQSANRTIAAVYPERVQLSMDEEEEEDFTFHPPSSVPFQETNVGSNNSPSSLPDVPKVNPPKPTNLPKKKSKMPTRLMSKKGLVKIGGEDEKVGGIKSSGLSKTEALEEIDKLQKEILALQTEKEFTKSSYENGLARFWEIEKRVTEMQGKVSNLQDEFGIGTVIEDDEARILMATAALKSCQETLAKLQEKRADINREAKTEYQRIYEAQEKFESIKEGHMSSSPMKDQETSEKSKLERESEYLKHLHEEAESVKQEMEKVEEQVLLGADNTVSISELAEKIDELVDKVISLETEVNSQTSLVKRLRSETNELHSHLQSFEEDKEILIEVSDSKSVKIRQLEEELRKVQSLNQNVQVQNQSLQTHFLIASSSIDQLSENLLNVKLDEEVQSTDLFEEAGGDLGENLFQHITTANKKNDEIVSCDDDLRRAKENYLRSKQRGFFDVVVEVGKVKAALKDNTERGFKDNPVIMSLGFNSKATVKKEARIEEEATKDGIRYQDFPVKAEEDNTVQPYRRTLGESLSYKGLVKDVMEDGQEKWFGEMMVSNSMVPKDAKITEVEKKNDILDSNNSPSQHLMKNDRKDNAEEEIKNEEMTLKEINVDGDSSESYLSNHLCSKAQEGVVKPYQIYHEDVLKNGLGKDASEDNPEKGFKPSEDKLALECDLNSMTSKDGRTEEEAKKTVTDNSVEPNQSIQHGKFLKKGRAKYVFEGRPEKGFANLEEGMALDISMISEGSIDADAETKKKDISSRPPLVKTEEDNNIEPYQNIQHETLFTKDVPQDKGGDEFNIDEDTKLKEKSMEVAHHPHHIRAQGGEGFNLDHLSVQSETSGVDANLDKGFSAIPTPDNGLEIFNHGQTSSTNAVTEGWYVSNPSNPFDDHYGITGSWYNGITGEEKDNNFPDSAPRIAQLGSQLVHSSEKGQQAKGRGESNSPESLKQVDKDTDELDTDEEDEPNWRHLFMYGLEDREKMLLEEYTSTLRNYKEVKKKLSEAEKRNRASLFKTTVQIKVLKSSNASKDAEIQSLHQKIDLFQTNIDQTPDLSSLEKEKDEKGEIKKEEEEGQIKKEDEEEVGEIKKIQIDEAPIVSTIEEKIRMDIDDMVEENIDFWLRFSIALHQIQKFQTAFHDLLTELKGVKEKKKQDVNPTKQDQSEIRPIYKHMRDILTELTLWWENTKVLKEDLEHRLSSLSSIQEEISRLSNKGGEREEGSELSDYQAAKFQGEVMNMQQENKKVADELRAGTDRVKRLQIDIEKTIAKLDDELGKGQQRKSSSNRSRIPLRSFLFGVKLKKQKPFFACMSPALQKQYSDLSALPP